MKMHYITVFKLLQNSYCNFMLWTKLQFCTILTKLTINKYSAKN